MKRFSLTTLMTLAGMVMAVQAQTSNGLLFEQINMTEKYRVDIPEEDRFDDRTYYQISTVAWQWPVSHNGKVPVNLQRAILENNSAPADIREVLRTSMRVSVLNEDYRLIPVKDVPNNAGSALMEDQDLLNVEYADTRIAVLRQQTYVYSGGAHGNNGTLYICYDLQKDKEITSDEVIANKKGVEKLILKKLMDRYGCNSLETLSEHLFLANFEVTDNIRIDSNGITFVYNAPAAHLLWATAPAITGIRHTERLHTKVELFCLLRGMFQVDVHQAFYL